MTAYACSDAWRTPRKPTRKPSAAGCAWTTFVVPRWTDFSWPMYGCCRTAMRKRWKATRRHATPSLRWASRYRWPAPGTRSASVYRHAGQFEASEKAYRQALAIWVRENELLGQAST